MAGKTAKKFFTHEEQERIIAAIERAERNTSGEIRLHLENVCSGDPYKRAKTVFEKIGMTKTQRRNGVLFYMAVGSKKFAVLGDKGIDAKVGAGFWDATVAQMSALFKGGKFAEGLIAGIDSAGERLKEHFPYQSDDVNELPDEISFGEE